MEYKEIIGFKDYLITSNGDVYSTLSNRYLKPSVQRGYKRVVLMRGGKKYHRTVHRLVLSTFKGTSRLECNHINGNPSDNRVCNLEWVTSSENSIHAHKILNRGYGKLTETQKMFIKQSDLPKVTLAKMFGVTRQTIHRIV